MALDKAKGSPDQEFGAWLQKVGYKYMIPTVSGIAMVTDFDMVYGDEARMIPVEEGKAMIKRKYWRYFGW